MRVNLSMDAVARDAYERIEAPRKVSVSKMLKWLMLAIVTPEKEFYKMRDASSEGRAVAIYLKGKLDKMFKNL